MKRIAIAAFTRRGARLAVQLAEGLQEEAAAAGENARYVPAAAPHDGDVRRTAATAPSSGPEGPDGGAGAPGGRAAVPHAGFLEDGLETTVAVPARLAGSCASQGVEAMESLDEWCALAFAGADALVFVGAAGIAVRAVAPYVRDKFRDPAVVCIDEAARFAVPLLSGHVGRANDLARTIARLTGAQPVISTATDVNGVFAVDEWAASLGLAICDRALAKKVSSVLLEGGQVGFASDFPVRGRLPRGLVAVSPPCGEVPPGVATSNAMELGVCVSLDEGKRPFAETLALVPCIVSVGVGCRRGLAPEALDRAVAEALEEQGVSPRALRTVASIDVKRDEPAVRGLAHKHGLDLRFFTADELNAVPGSFASSAFVLKTVGTGNVCERAAVAASGGGRLIMGKRAFGGATVALAVPRGFGVSFGGAAGADDDGEGGKR